MSAFLGSIFAILIALLPAPAAFAAVGTIDSFDGDVRVSFAGSEVPAAAGLELQEGATVITGAGAWALLTMSDNATLTLRPMTRVKIETYRYDPDGKPASHSSVISLVQGAFRSITGLIGKTNRDGYRIVTPNATIGIRGTDHEPAYFPPPEPGARAGHESGTYDKVNSGSSYVRNDRGEVAIERGQSGFVHHDGSRVPRLLARPPRFYREHAEIDKRAQERRNQFHQRTNTERQRAQQTRAGERAQKKEERAAKQAEKREQRQKQREKAPRADHEKKGK